MISTAVVEVTNEKKKSSCGGISNQKEEIMISLAVIKITNMKKY